LYLEGSEKGNCSLRYLTLLH